MRTRALAGAVAVLAVALAAGCGAPNKLSATSAATPVAVTAADDEASASLLVRHHYHHHGGVTLFVAMSLDTLGVPEDKRGSLERLQAELRRAMDPTRIAEQALAAALADGVAAASFDEARIYVAITVLGVEAAKSGDASADALNELHRLLSPDERAALVQKVSSHWQVWQDANMAGIEPSAARRTYLQTLASEQALTTRQVADIRMRLAERAATHGTPAEPAGLLRSEQGPAPDGASSGLRAFGDAFASEPFDARTLAGAWETNGRMAALGAAHLAVFVQAVSPVLTPDQRATFAHDVRYHATHDELPSLSL